MARRNGYKKAMKKRGGDTLLRSESKMKRDYNFYDYCDFFYDVYDAETDEKCRNNLKKWNEGDTDEK